MKKEYPIKVDGDVVTIDPKKMKVDVMYPYIYNGEKYGSYKDSEGTIHVVEILD